MHHPCEFHEVTLCHLPVRVPDSTHHCLEPYACGVFSSASSAMALGSRSCNNLETLTP